MTHKPTDEIRAQVFALSSFGVTQEVIGKFIGISDDTLRKNYGSELDRAAIDRNAEVAAFLFRSANGSTLKEGASYSDCLKAAMFWMKTRAQWRETARVEHSGPDGGPIQIEDVTVERLIAEATRLGLDPDALGLSIEISGIGEGAQEEN